MIRRDAFTIVGAAVIGAVLITVATWVILWFGLAPNTMTIAGNIAVVVTGLIIFWYTLETSRLRRQGADQTKATQEQAAITRQIFEASQRPFLKVSLDSSSFFNDPDHYRVDFGVANRGPVPAVIVRWVVEIIVNGATVREHVSGNVTKALFVGDDVTLQARPTPFSGGQIQQDALEVMVRARVRYESPAGRSYESWLDSRGRYGSWRTDTVGFSA
jgi:hypothetical protein